MHLTSVIPVYNGLPFIVPLLESLAVQSRRADRIVVIDNASTDETVAAVAEFAASHEELNVEIRSRPENVGSLRNFNEALDLAKETDLFHLISHDDILEPEFFARMIPLLEGVEGRGLAFCRYHEIDEHGAVTRPFHPPADPRPIVRSRRNFLGMQSELHHIYLQTAIFKTDRQPPPVYFQDRWFHSADVVFFAEHGLHCNHIVELPVPLVQYRVHRASTTGATVSRLESFVHEEWRAMMEVAELIDEEPTARWLRRQKLRCVFGARSRVKVQMMQRSNPRYAREILAAGRRIAGPLGWTAGSLAVAVRDAGFKLMGRTVRAGD